MGLERDVDNNNNYYYKAQEKIRDTSITLLLCLTGIGLIGDEFGEIGYIAGGASSVYAVYKIITS